MFIFPAFFGRAKIHPSQAFLRELVFRFSPQLYVKVRLIDKFCCYFRNFCKSKSCNFLVSMNQNTAAGRYEIRAP